MTINIFLAIFASILLLVGFIGCTMADSDEEGIGFTGVAFIACSIPLFIITFLAPNNYEIHFYHWLIFICPFTYIIMLIWNFFTKKYVLPWNRDYYKEYRSLRKEFDALQDDYDELNKIYHKLEQSYQKDIKDILNKQSIKNNNNSKLYF